ncbi:phosphatase PAP2 family protein [Agrococcus lahaulensis]|uniref:phosphatase PAP2 family protein n=1 Tax=Agrococcus lahaulensis TaxID=341722 RepID=UPI00047BB6DC|nr:phosphatase PAP2 family protein [Agrococcus lahaulensis]
MQRDRDEPKATGSDAEVAGERHVGAKDLTSWSTRAGRVGAALVHRVSDLLGPHAALVLILAVGAAVAALATLAAAWVYDAVTEPDGVAGLDRPVLAAFEAVRSPWLDAAVTWYTNLGGPIVMPVIAVLAIVILSLRRRNWAPVLIIGGAGAGSLLMTIVGKGLVARVRPGFDHAVPPFERSPSFPSGHALNATAIAGAIAYMLLLRQSKRVIRAATITVAVVFAASIGISRIYLGHHWFTDVLVAWVLGVGWLAVVITAHRLSLTARRRQQTTPTG